MLEHLVQAFYYAAIHLMFASIVSLAAWALTTVPRGSATTKYWIWTATSVNFFLPVGAILDRLWATHLSWARPLGSIGGPIHDFLQNAAAAALLGVVWLLGATLMLVRLWGGYAPSAAALARSGPGSSRRAYRYSSPPTGRVRRWPGFCVPGSRFPMELTGS